MAGVSTDQSVEVFSCPVMQLLHLKSGRITHSFSSKALLQLSSVCLSSHGELHGPAADVCNIHL